MKIDPTKYIRLGTAATVIGVTRAYVLRMVKADRLPAVSIDGQWFVKATDAERFRRNRGISSRT